MTGTNALRLQCGRVCHPDDPLKDLPVPGPDGGPHHAPTELASALLKVTTPCSPRTVSPSEPAHSSASAKPGEVRVGHDECEDQDGEMCAAAIGINSS